MKSSACPSENRLASFVLGRLEELELERVIAHAETCSKCRRRLEELDHHTDALLRRLREPLRADPVEREPNLHNMLGSLTTSSSEVTVMAPPPVTASWPRLSGTTNSVRSGIFASCANSAPAAWGSSSSPKTLICGVRSP